MASIMNQEQEKQPEQLEREARISAGVYASLSEEPETDIAPLKDSQPEMPAEADPDVLVEAIGVRQFFEVKKSRGKKALVKAVDDVSFSIRRGETFGLVGESGCGKSTLGKTFLRLTPLTGGQVLFDGQDISRLRGKALKRFSCQSQMIFQDPSSCLNPRRKIEDILTEPYKIHHLYDKSERINKVRELCDMVGLSRNYLFRYPHEMSGGQKQRVGIARALALNPRLIVCDEPVSALDVSVQARLLDLLRGLVVELNLAVVIVTHDLGVARLLADRLLVMKQGQVVESGLTDRVLDDPHHPYTQLLVSSVLQN